MDAAIASLITGQEHMNSKPQIFSGRIIFDHMQKTAGQAVNAWLAKNLGNGCVTPNLNGEHRYLIRRYGGEYSVISGHVHFEGNGLDPRYHYITCFRDPLDRAISWLYFVIKNHESTQLSGIWEGVERFISTDGEELEPKLSGYISNPYVEHFSKVISTAQRSGEQKLADALFAVEQYDVFGFYEELPVFLADVAALIGLPTPDNIERVNVTRSRPAIEQITPLLRKHLEELNALDLEFYRLLSERYRRGGGRTRQVTTTSINSTHWEPYQPVQDRRVFAVPELVLMSAELGGGSTITPGATLCFELKFSLSVAIANLMVCIHILDEEGRRAFSTDTTQMGLPLLQVGKGTHLVRYCLIAQLPAGQYKVSFVFVEHKSAGSRELALYDKLIEFRVMVAGLMPGGGYASLPVEFGYQQLGEAVLEQIADATGTIESAAVLSDLEVGEHFALPVKLINASTQVWSDTVFNPIKLSYQWVDLEGKSVVSDGLRTQLPVREVMPGQRVAAKMRVVAPRTPGRYRLLITPVQEGRFWFDKRGFTPAVHELVVFARGARRCYHAADFRLFSQVGKRDGSAIVSTGQDGFLLYGPYAQLPGGRYIARIEGKFELGSTGAWIDVSLDQGKRVLARKNLTATEKIELPFELAESAEGLEARLWVTAGMRLRVEALCIEPESSGANAPSSK